MTGDALPTSGDYLPCDCLVPWLEGDGNHSPDCASFRPVYVVRAAEARSTGAYISGASAEGKRLADAIRCPENNDS